MSTASPAIPLFGDAYIADTRHLSLEEHGAYLTLMMIAWRAEDCSLPDDDARIARMLGVTAKKWAKLKPTVMSFWCLEDGRWTQKRLSKERQYVAKKSKQNAESANARWNSKPLKTNDVDDANASPAQCERNAPPPSLSKEEEESKIMPDRSGDEYAFFGQTIKLAPRHMTEWRRVFHAILDINAELSTIDDWWQQEPQSAKRENWFLATKGMLNKKHQLLLRQQADAGAEARSWDCMP